MPETVEMIRVYQVDWCFSNMTQAQMKAAGVEAAGIDPFGESWTYNDYQQAADRAKKCLDRVPDSEIVLATCLMTPEEYAELPPDDDLEQTT